MTDRVGTVRVSPEGVVAFRAETAGGGWWLASKHRDAEVWNPYYHSQEQVADWEIVYTPPAPPHPVGTVLRREGELLDSGKPFWEVAVRVDKGWFVLEQNYEWARLDDVEPYDNEDGAWEVIHGNTGN